MTASETTTAAVWQTAEVEERVEVFLAQMSTEEKVGFVTGDLNWNYGFYAGPLERLGLPALQMADGPAGVRINKGDVHDGEATALPAPIALAATWDPDLAREYGAVIGVECRATDHNVSLGPAVDIARIATGGRTFESFGEDPLLTSRIGAEVVRGIQDQGVQACAKHYAINNQEYQRSSIDAVIDERTMMEVYLPPFQALVDAGVASMMAAFNRVNGDYACENHPLLTEILRERLGFRGWVMSDYGANHSTAPAANAGLDQEQPGEGHWGSKLLAAVRAGEVAEAVLDEKVRRILRPLVGLGQLENPPGVAEFAVDAHHEIARRIAEETMVLLRNDGVLPLRGADLRRVAVIGPDVDAVGARGGGSSMVKPTKTSSPLDGLTRHLGADVEVVHAYGADPITPGALLPGPDPIPSGFLATPDGEPGLRGEYWTNTGFAGDPFAVRVDPQVDQNLGFFNFPGFNASSPRLDLLPGELNGRISARWTGTLTPPVDGSYRLTIAASGSFTLALDGDVVLRSAVDPGVGEAAAEQETDASYGNNGAGGPVEVHGYEVALELGARPYALRLDYAADDPGHGHLVGTQLRLGWTPPAGVVAPLVAEAVALAATADVAVVVVRDYESEADDRPHLRLPNGQHELVSAVVEANPRTVVVLMTGSPVDVSGWRREPAALVQAWFPGQAQGDALGRVLTGEAEPGGRLPLTFPVDLGQTPAADPVSYPGVDGRVEYTDGVLVGYRGYDAAGLEPAYPFGHGLSYASFEYRDLEVTAVDGEAVARVACTVRNTGDRAGAEVVQVYVGGLDAPVVTAPKQLAAFTKVRLAADDETRVELAVPRRAVSYYDVAAGDWVTPAGVVDVLVGASSRDVRLTGTVAVA